MVRELLKSGGWKIRALTRKPDGDEANKLRYYKYSCIFIIILLLILFIIVINNFGRDQGVEIVAGDVSKKEDLEKAFAVCTSSFLIILLFHYNTFNHIINNLI